MIVELLFFVELLRPQGERKSSVIMLLACRDGDETGNRRGWTATACPRLAAGRRGQWGDADVWGCGDGCGGGPS